MSLGAQIFVGVMAVVMLAAAVGQILSYRRGEQLLAPAQLVMRLSAAGLVLAILVLSTYWMLHQPQLLAPGLTREAKLTLLRGAALYWSVVVLLVVAVLVLTVVDFRYVQAARHRVRAAMYRNLDKLQEELRRQFQAETQAQLEAGPAGPPSTDP